MLQDNEGGSERARSVDRGREMNRERTGELTDDGGDLATMTACSALTHVTTSRRASAIFVSRDTLASTGCTYIVVGAKQQIPR